MEALRALSLAGMLLLCAASIGGAALRAAGLERKDLYNAAEGWLLATTAGLGVLALGYTLLGLAGAFQPAVVLAVPLLLAIVALPAARPMLRGASTAGTAPTHTPARLTPVTLAALGSTGLAVLFYDLAPPTDYDGLLYHLVTPRAFLAAGRIVYLAHNFSANLPALGELLFAFGLAGGSDKAPALVHGAAGALAVGLTYTFGARLFGRQPAFWGAAVLAATPLVPFLGTRAYIDLFTVLFGLLAIAGVLFWQETGRRAWLRLAGAGAGLALATKYSAVSLVLVLGVAILVMAWLKTRPRGGSQGVGATINAGAVFGAIALLFALPWYARQLIALGNPVWPMYLGGKDWDALRVEQLSYFIAQYGTGHGRRDWLLLPWNVYRQSWRFGHVPDSYPPLLALAAPLALLVRRPAARWCLAITAGAVLLWAVSVQDLRFLLTLYPVLALLGAAGIGAAFTHRPLARLGRAGPLAVSAAIAVLCLIAARREVLRAADAAGVVFGREPLAAYLDRRLTDFRAIETLNAQVAPGSAVLFLGDGQIWYCRPRCIPDPAHDNLLQWFVRPGDNAAALRQLQAEGVSHILLSKVDYWYLEHQDPQDRLRRQLDAFYLFKASYLELVYEDAATEVYRGRW